MNPHLDDWLESQPTSLLKSKRKMMKFLKQAYGVCVGNFANKPRTDITTQDGTFSFHMGSPLPDLRQISSWMLTHSPNQRKLAKLIPALWKRHGREDVSMAGLFLANLSLEDLAQGPWMAFIHLLQKKEPLSAVLEVAEEIVRGGHTSPNDEWLIAASEQSPHWHQYCVLFLSLRKDQIDASRHLISTAPKGGELFERIRERLLIAEH